MNRSSACGILFAETGGVVHVALRKFKLGHNVCSRLNQPNASHRSRTVAKIVAKRKPMTCT